MLPREFSFIALTLFIPELVNCASNNSSFDKSSIIVEKTKSFSSTFTMSSYLPLSEGAHSVFTSASVGEHTTSITATLASSTASLNETLKGDISSNVINPSTSNSIFQVPSTIVNGTLQYFDTSTVDAQAAGSSTAGFIATSPAATTSAGPMLNISFSSSVEDITQGKSSYNSLLGTSMPLLLSTGLSRVVSQTLSPVIHPLSISMLSPSSSTFHTSVKITSENHTDTMASDWASAVAETSITHTTVTISSRKSNGNGQGTSHPTLSTSVYSSVPLFYTISNPESTSASAKLSSPVSPKTPTQTSTYVQKTPSLTPYPSLSMRNASTSIRNNSLQSSSQAYLGPSVTATVPFNFGSSSTIQTSLIIASPMTSPALNYTSISSNISLQANDSVTRHLKTTEVYIFNSGILTFSPSKILKQTSAIALSITERSSYVPAMQSSSYVPAMHSSSYVPASSQVLPPTKKPTDNKNETFMNSWRGYATIGGGGAAFIIIMIIIVCCVCKRGGRAKDSTKLQENEGETGEKIDWTLKWSTMRQNDVFTRKSLLQMTVYGEANNAFLTDLDEKNNKPPAFLDLSGNGAHEDTEVDENSNDDLLLRCRTFSGSGNRHLNGGQSQSLLDVVKQKRKSRELDADIIEEVFEENEQPNETVNVEYESNKSRQVKQSSFSSFAGNHEPSKTGPSLSFIEDTLPKHSSFSEDQTVSLASGRSGSLREIDETDHCEESSNQSNNTPSQLERTPNESLGSPTGEDARTEPNAIENAISEQESLSGSTETSLISDKAVTPAASSQDLTAPEAEITININDNEQKDIDDDPKDMKEGAEENGTVSLESGSPTVKNLEPEDAQKRLSEYYC